MNISPVLLEPALPASVGWWPQTPAWYALASILLLLSLWRLIRHWLRWRHNRYRHYALQQLATIKQYLHTSDDRQWALLHLAELLKKTAAIGFPHHQLQSLSGKAWLNFLNASTEGEAIDKGMIEWPFWSSAQLKQLTPQQLDKLIRQTRAWIETHRVTD